MSRGMASMTGVPEKRERANRRGGELNELAAVAATTREAELLDALRRIRERDGVSLTRHVYNAGEFVDDFIDDLIDEWIA